MESLEDADGNDKYSVTETRIIAAANCHYNDSDSSHDEEIMQGMSTS